MIRRGGRLTVFAVAAAWLLAGTLTACARAPRYRSFATPEDAVRALTAAVDAGNMDEVIAIFGPEGRELAGSSDPATARRNQQVFATAVAERWYLEDRGTDERILVVGNEDWPFPVPIVRGIAGWRFDTEAGKEEVLVRRIGRNELAAIRTCLVYVAAQRRYAREGHDGKPAGLYARKFRSDAGRHDGLYWVPASGERRSPLGDLVAAASAEDHRPGPDPRQPAPFQGYYFRILTAQGPSARGGEIDYLADGELSRGFALVAWPAQYDVTGVMTFIVNQHGVVHEKDLGSGTPAAVAEMTRFDPDATWSATR
jgi:hypothetical protein